MATDQPAPRSLDKIKATIASLKAKAAAKEAANPSSNKRATSSGRVKGSKPWRHGMSDSEWEEFKKWRKGRK